MRYSYFPGCSLKGTGRAYDESFRAVCAALDIGLDEVPDWNCCGATAYMAVSEQTATVLAGRNLALAESMGRDVVAPCSGCYLVLHKTQHAVSEHPAVRAAVTEALGREGLKYKGTVKIRHPIDVLVHDVRPLRGFAVAPYYGCQIVRPYAEFDDLTNPQTMDALLGALGAEVVAYPLKTRCCGGSLTGTVPEVGQRLSFDLLREAQKRGANVLSTTCPLCQFNLDAYQREISSRYEPVRVPVLYFTQLVGIAFGLDDRQLGLQRGIVPFRLVPAADVAQRIAS
jgi:heterodisulfide reductase subunit B